MFENLNLTEDVRKAVLEAFEEKLSETRIELEKKIREEFSSKYEYDKAQLVKAMEAFLEAHLEKELKSFEAAKKALVEKHQKVERQLAEQVRDIKSYAKETLESELRELREEKERLAKRLAEVAVEKKRLVNLNEKRLSRLISNFENLAESQLKNFVKELVEERKNVAQKKHLLEGKFNNEYEKLRREFSERINMLEKFVVSKLSDELREFNEDRKLLEKRRVELEVEARRTLEEAKKDFIKRAASLVEKTVTNQMESELRALKEDLRYARENHFGRRIFEAFAAEFMSSYLAEGTRIKEVMNQLNEMKSELENMRVQLKEKDEMLKSYEQRSKLLEEEARRSKVMADLLAPLPKKQRDIMESLLKDVRTEKLTEKFKQYLPEVMQASGNKKADKAVELKEEHVAVFESADHEVVTGDRKTSSSNDDPVILKLRYLAGLK